MCLPFSAAHAAFQFICLKNDFFTCVSQGSVPALLVSALFRCHAAFLFMCLPGDFCTSPNRLLLGALKCVRLVFPSCLPSCPPFLLSVLSPFCLLLSPFLLVTVSALSPFIPSLSPVLSPFLWVTVSVLFPFFCFFLPSVSFCLPSCHPSC